MRSSIADALATARKAAEAKIRGLMFTIIMHNAGRIDTITSNYRDWETDRKSTRLNSSHSGESRMPSSA